MSIGEVKQLAILDFVAALAVRDCLDGWKQDAEAKAKAK